jgi:hypothetical protein
LVTSLIDSLDKIRFNPRLVDPARRLEGRWLLQEDRLAVAGFFRNPVFGLFLVSAANSARLV